MDRNALLLAIGLVGLTEPAAAQDILGGAKASVSLSIGIKGADRQPDVDFIVIQPGGGKSTATAKAHLNGESPGTVSYPDDFTNAGMHSGTYRWTASTRGKTIASGTFKYLPSKTGLQAYTAW